MKATIIGCRQFNNYPEFCQYINAICKQTKMTIDCIYTGNANGACALARQFASDNNIELKIFSGTTQTNDSLSGMIFNDNIINECDCVFLFGDITCEDIYECMKVCKDKNKKFFIHKFL